MVETGAIDPSSLDEVEDALEVLGALVAELEDYRIHLTAGRFVEAVGFAIEGEDNIAVPEEVEEDEAGELVYSLTWTTRGQ